MYSAGFESHSSAAWPLRGLALRKEEESVSLGGKGYHMFLMADILVRLPQKALQAQQHTLHIVHRAPLVLQDIQANTATKVDVRVIYWGLEQDRRWSVWICKRKLEG